VTIVALVEPMDPIPMLLWCPLCFGRHIDEGEFATKPHHTHSCQYCGNTWRPAVVATVGVDFLPGFANDSPPPYPGDAWRRRRNQELLRALGNAPAVTRETLREYLVPMREEHEAHRTLVAGCPFCEGVVT
jgi:hypothetical protein